MHANTLLVASLELGYAQTQDTRDETLCTLYTNGEVFGIYKKYTALM